MILAARTVVGRGRFELLGPLGRGGGGDVYSARERETGAVVALKSVSAVGGPEAFAALKREFRAVQDLAHPNIVRLDELFEEEGAWFFTMELVPGPDWLSYVRRDSSGDFALVRATAAQLAEALDALHDAGLLHRDVKPSNVLVSDDGHVKLLDFGISVRKGAFDATEGIAGTILYMAPEQLLAQPLTPACDFYALGVMLREALTGASPFGSIEANSVIRRKLEGRPLRPTRDETPRAPEDLASLCDALLQTSPDARPDAAAVLTALGSSRRRSSSQLAVSGMLVRFVGRHAELRAVAGAFDEARAGKAVAVVVEGPSGVGKSALVRQAMRDLGSRALVLEGRCHEREHVPYNGIDAIVDQLATYLGEHEDDVRGMRPSASRLLPRMFPALAGVEVFAQATREAAGPPEGEAHELRARTFAALRELLGRVAARQPVVLVIDDLQWADRDTLSLLAEVLAPPFPSPVLLVATQRTPEEGAGEPVPLALDVRRIRVPALADDEVTELASHLPLSAQFSQTELSSLAAESRGHPLFLQELVRHRASSAADAPPPVRLEDALLARVAQLDERGRRVVEALAVAAVPVDADVVAAAAGVERRDLRAVMHALTAAHLVKASRAGGRRQLEAFHGRLGEAVRARFEGGARRTWHERIAKALEASPDADVEQLANHWEGAGDGPRAALLLRQAGDRAGDALAFDRAVDLYERARRLTTAPPDQVALDHALAEALKNAGRGADSARKLLALAGDRVDTEGLALRTRAADAFLCSGHYADGIDALRGGIAAVGLWFPRGRLALFLRILWYRLRLRLRGLGFRRREPDRIEPRRSMRVDLCWAAVHGFGMTDSIAAIAWNALSTRMALDLGDPLRASRALAAYAPIPMLLAGKKGLAQSQALIEAAKTISAGLNAPYVEAFTASSRGLIALLCEDFPASAAHYERAEVAFRDRCVGTSYELGAVRTLAARVYTQLGRLDRLAALSGSILRDALRRNDQLTACNLRTTAAAIVQLAHGDVAAAEAEVSTAGAALSSRSFQLAHLYWLLADCNVCCYRGSPERAVDTLERHRASIQRALLDRSTATRIILAAAEARMRLSLAARDEGRRDESLAVARDCAQRLAREELPASSATAELIEATIAALRGDKASAASKIERVEPVLERLSMKLHLYAARAARGRLVEGDAGRALTGEAEASMRALGIAEPRRFSELYAPGL